MLAALLSLFPAQAKRHVYSLSSSEISSLDALSLPSPVSPQQFGANVWQEDGHFRTGGRPTARETVPWWTGGFFVRPTCSHLCSMLTVQGKAFAPVLLVIILFPLSTMLVLAGLISLPITAAFPRTLSQLTQLGQDLQAYSDSGLRPKAHVLAVLSVTALWKHAWSIPGSVLLVSALSSTSSASNSNLYSSRTCWRVY